MKVRPYNVKVRREFELSPRGYSKMSKHRITQDIFMSKVYRRKPLIKCSLKEIKITAWIKEAL